MNGRLYLVGGGEIRENETKKIDDEVKSLASPGDSLVFFPTAAGDSHEYAQVVESVYGSAFNVVVATQEKGRDFAHSAVRDAAVVYLGGGDPEVLLKLFKKWELVETLRAAWRCGTCIVGMSAGAYAMSHSFIQEEDSLLKRFFGWGFYPGCLIVHANKASFEAAKTLFNSIRKDCPDELLGIGEGVAWCVEEGVGRMVGEGELFSS